MDLPCIVLQPWWRHIFLMSQKYWCIVDSWLMISDQANSFLKWITFSFKSLTYCIPLASCFRGDFVTHKSRYHHVMRSQTLVFALNPKLWSENTGPDFNLAYENPALLLPLIQGALPSSVIPTVSSQYMVPPPLHIFQGMVLPCHLSVIVE